MNRKTMLIDMRKMKRLDRCTLEVLATTRRSLEILGEQPSLLINTTVRHAFELARHARTFHASTGGNLSNCAPDSEV